MAVIEEIPVRAKIYTGGVLLAETPYIVSFSVSKSRGQLSSFTASVKVKSEIFDTISTDISIYAGPKDSLTKIFTGLVKKAVPNPSWDDPSYLIVSLTGVDILSELEDKKFNRRQTHSKNSWAKIDSVVRQGPKSGKFNYIKEPTIYVSEGDYEKASAGSVNVGIVDMPSLRKDQATEKDNNIKLELQNIVPFPDDV